MAGTRKGLAPGDPIPRFELPDQDGAIFRVDDALEKGPLVVFFYPKDETAGCTAEACSFRDAHESFVAAGATVVGISSDDVTSHKRFASRHNLPYRILADVGGEVRRRFGVPRGLFGLIDGRVTYVADQQGVVRNVFEGTLQTSAHMREALTTVKLLSAARSTA